MFCMNSKCKLLDRYHYGPCAVEIVKPESQLQTINNTYYNQTYIMNYNVVNVIYNNDSKTENSTPVITDPFNNFKQLIDKSR